MKDGISGKLVGGGFLRVTAIVVTIAPNPVEGEGE
jgi:hypothetical protein